MAMKRATSILWVTPGQTDSRNLVIAVAHEFKLEARFCTHDEVSTALGNQQYGLVGIELGVDPQKGIALLKEVHRRLPHSPILAASGDPSVGLIRSALEAGASDFITLPLAAPELHRVLIKFTQLERRTLGSGEPGEVITLCGARGGLGVTTLAVNLAVRLHALTHSPVALVDLDLQRGDVTAFLDMTPMESVAALAGARDKLDEVFVRGTLTRHSSGVLVLAAPPHVEEAELVGHEDLAAAIPLLRAQFRYTVIDTSRTITGPVLAALEQADRILLLSEISVPGVRAARRLHELLARISPDPGRIELLISDVHPSPVKMADALRAIGKDQALLVVPRDEAQASAAANAGVPLNGASPSPLADAIAALAAKLAGMPAEAHGLRRSLLQRFLPRGRRSTAEV